MAQNEQNVPFLAQSRDSQDIELSQLDGDLGHAVPKSPTFGAAKPASPWLISLVLFVTVAGFVVNTEATAYYEDVLAWKKPWCSMYITHSSLAVPWICYLAYHRLTHFIQPYRVWVREYNDELRGSVASIEAFANLGPRFVWKRAGALAGPLDYLASAMAIVTLVLTVSGSSWFVSLSLTTPSDLTAIYNCSTFFAAAFSVPLLRQNLGWISIIAVALSIVGTFIIAYGDTTAEHPLAEEASTPQVGDSRLLGNIIALVGTVAFGLYEVLFKKYACSSRPVSASQSLPLTFAASALTGIYTFFTFWAALILFHTTGIEPFVWPSAVVAAYVALAVFTGIVGITGMLVLVIWTNPVFGSLASVLVTSVIVK